MPMSEIDTWNRDADGNAIVKSRAATPTDSSSQASSADQPADNSTTDG